MSIAGTTGFDPSKLTPEQKQTWDMQQELNRQQQNGTMMNMMIQYQQQQQKEKFDLLSNTIKRGEDTQSNVINNTK